MSNCPNCDRKLRLTDWRPNCPGCGVNLMFHGFEQRFYEDAKRSELSMAAARARLVRFKAGYMGSPATRLRLFTCALPLLSLLLPMGSLGVRLPFYAETWQAGLLGLANLALGGYKEPLAYLWAMAQTPDWGPLFRCGLLLLALAAGAAVFAVLAMLFSLFCFLSQKRMSVIAGAVSCLGALLSIAGLAAGILLHGTAADSAFFTGSIGFGAPLTLLLFCLVAALNFRVAKRGFPVRYAEGEYERTEIYRRVRRGEITLDELPFPVVETEETRKRQAEIDREIGGPTV